MKGTGSQRCLARLLAAVLSALFLAGLTTSSGSGPIGPMALSVSERLTVQHGDVLAVLPRPAVTRHLMPAADLLPPTGDADDLVVRDGRALQHQQSRPSATEQGLDRSRAPPLTG